jgi:hypothetical protein
VQRKGTSFRFVNSSGALNLTDYFGIAFYEFFKLCWRIVSYALGQHPTRLAGWMEGEAEVPGIHRYSATLVSNRMVRV